MSRYASVESLAADHEVAEFDCGSEAQTVWLRDYALQAHRSDTAKVYVVCLHQARTVVGYYALAAGSIQREDVPPRITKGMGRYPVPVLVLTRLGVDLSNQGRGLGSALLRDAFLQAASVSQKVGVRALLIHAETPEAVAFYRRIDSSFEESPTDPLHLILLMKDLRAAIREATIDPAPVDEPEISGG